MVNEINSQPLVSIIVPVHNAAKYLEQTIQSVVNQTFNNWQLIIVDDGSTDNSAAIAKMYLNDSRVIFFSKPNTGVSDTRNFGADKAKGSYLCFLDADDLFYADNLQEKVEFLDANKQCALVHADVEIINDTGQPTGQYYKGKGGNVLKDLLLWQHTVIPAPSSIMVRTGVFYEIGKWDATFSTAADQDFFFRLAAKYTVGHIAKVLTAYRVLSNSMSRNIAVMEKDHIGVYKKAAKNGFFTSYWFRQRCFAKLYLALAGSWWVNGGNKKRGLYFLASSIITYPPIIIKLAKKIGN